MSYMDSLNFDDPLSPKTMKRKRELPAKEAPKTEVPSALMLETYEFLKVQMTYITAALDVLEKESADDIYYLSSMKDGISKQIKKYEKILKANDKETGVPGL